MDTSVAACLNSQADHYASSAQNHITSIPIAPIPTFFMDSYTFHCEMDGWIESSIRHFVRFFGAKSTADRLASLPKHQMASWLYDPTPPPLWLYTKATSAYTALVQLYARSGQLATAEGVHQKDKSKTSSCRFGCPTTESLHHLFVECARYAGLWGKELKGLVEKVEGRFEEANVSNGNSTGVIGTVKSLFQDSSTIWLLQSSTFYLGQIPKLDPLLPLHAMTSRVDCSRLLFNIATDMHISSVHLTSRIYGDVQREMSKRHAMGL